MKSKEEIAIAYHDRTKHRPNRFARSLGYMDWANQPDPFRRFDGSTRIALDRREPDPDSTSLFDEVYRPNGREPAPLDRVFVSQLLFDTLALSAWKRAGMSRWSLRCNPSSGNLHPTEGYVCLPAIADLAESPAIYHYCPYDHSLERRFELDENGWLELTEGLPAGGFLFGFSSIHWRESWKYGERAYRYCQLDLGHAVAQLGYAAATLGWHVRLLEGVADDAIASLLGIDQQTGLEAELPDALLCVCPAAPNDRSLQSWSVPTAILDRLRALEPEGTANVLSAGHHDWDVIEEVAGVCLRAGAAPEALYDTRPHPDPPFLESRPISARHLFRTRRSAVDMDPEASLPRDAFVRILQRLMPADAVPWAALPWRPVIHPLLMVHRVSDLTPGLYLLWRDADRAEQLRTVMNPDLAWEPVTDLPAELPLFRLDEVDARQLARGVNCRQDIASDGVFAVEMIADFEQNIRTFGSWMYRRLYWEAGALGQVLYLEAEAAGVRGTGIGCFFDDVVHELLGISDHTLQMLYGFTVGAPVEDTRLSTEPAYHHIDEG